jgi:hypothetical protein
VSGGERGRAPARGGGPVVCAGLAHWSSEAPICALPMSFCSTAGEPRTPNCNTRQPSVGAIVSVRPAATGHLCRRHIGALVHRPLKVGVRRPVQSSAREHLFSLLLIVLELLGRRYFGLILPPSNAPQFSVNLPFSHETAETTAHIVVEPGSLTVNTPATPSTTKLGRRVCRAAGGIRHDT